LNFAFGEPCEAGIQQGKGGGGGGDKIDRGHEQRKTAKMKLLPKGKIFFELFEAQAEKLLEMAALLKELTEDYEKLPEIAARAKVLEDEADTIVHKIATQRDSCFVTPIDREDIAMLAHNVDEVVDCVERALNRMNIYKARVPPEVMLEFSRIINACADEIKKGVECLKNLKQEERKLIEHCIRINDLEAEADSLNRRWLATIITEPVTDAKSILEKIVTKEIVETLESATDRCEDVANVLETIRIRNI